MALQDASAQTSMAQSSGGLLLTPTQLSALKGDTGRFTTILKNCDATLNTRPAPLAILKPANHYDTSGANAPTEEGKRLTDDAVRAYRQALCYALTDDSKYAASSQRILDAWANTFKGVKSLQGRAAVNFNLPYMIVAAGWVKNANAWKHASFDRFLRTTILPLAALDNPNNQGMWAIFMQSAIGAYLGDQRILKAARNNWQTHIQHMVAADGRMPHEIARSDTSNYVGGPTKGIRGLAYTNYALLPTALAAQVLAVAGKPVWATKSGVLLHKAFTKAAGWVLHPETFPYYASNQGQLQDINGVSYFPLLLKEYPNSDAEAVLKERPVKADGFLLMKLFGGQ